MEANSTEAVQTYSATNNGETVVSVTVTYSIAHAFCYPSGLEITISGAVNWGSNQSGTIGLETTSPAISTTAEGAWYGNQSGVALGIIWPSSSAYPPTFDASSHTLAYTVGSSFSIDPSIIATPGSGDGYALETPAERTSFYGDGLYWVFFLGDASGNMLLYYSTSSNAKTWSTATEIASNAVNGGYSVWFDGAYVYYVFSTLQSSQYYMSYNAGAISATGSISWVQSQQLLTNSADVGYPTPLYPTVTTDASGHAWVGAYAAVPWPGYGSYQSCGYLYKSSTTGGAWTLASGFPDATFCNSGSSEYPIGEEDLVPLANGDVVAITAEMGFSWAFQTWTGSSPGATATSSMYDYGNFAAVGYGNNVAVAAQDSSSSDNYDWVYAFYSFASNSVSTGFVRANSLEFAGAPTLSVDQTSGNLYAFFDDLTGSGSYEISYMKYVAAWGYQNGWNPVSTLFSTGSNYAYYSEFDSTYSNSGGMIGLTMFYEITYPSVAQNIQFSAIPAPTPTAASSPDSWSKPGVSPYESYFQDNTEYVSPGNGLLGITANDLSIAGRGLDLEITRVFSTPYAFDSSSPNQYDNYTLTNLGYGWSLDFPWMGTNYLHLTDGQAYPYSWTGNVFQYNGAANFELVNSSGTYSLYLADGTDYQFNSLKHLTSITDSTGNNTISFSYGSNGYISQITDAIGRTATFSYNTNNTLASISSGGRTIYYYYHGYDLSSVKNAVGDITQYQYSTGTNSWLISAVLYPTGGKSTYMYGSASVGTELNTYYVTSRNIYSSSSAISQSDSFSYTVANGAVTSTRETISNGISTQDYQYYVFSQGYKPFMRVYDVNSTNSVISITESDFDSSGSINETKSLTPSSVLTTALVGYWPLNEGTGSTTADLSGNNNLGTLVDSPTWETGTNCEFGDCLSFSGSSYVSVATTPGLSPEVGASGAITLSAWVYPTSWPSLGSLGTIIGKELSGNYEYSLNVLNNGNGYFYIDTQSGGVVCQSASPSALSLDTWQLLTATYSAASGNCIVYLNGVAGSSEASSGVATAGSANVAIGSDTGGAQGFKGSIDDARIYGLALSAGEISTLYASYSVSTGLIANWPIEEGSGTTTADASGNGHAGTLVNSPVWSVSCEFGNCLKFSSSSSTYVSSSDSGFPSGSSARSVFMWIDPTACASGDYYILQEYGTYGDSFGAAYPYLLGGASSCDLSFNAYGGYFQSTLSIPLNTWTLVGYTYSSGSSSVTLWSGTSSQTGSLGGALNTVLTGVNDIGILNEGRGVYVDGFTGEMTDAQVYNAALSSAEVTALHGLSAPLTQILALSETTYDNWGNVIYTQDPMGQQTYYSYSNADSQNTFVTPLASGLLGYWSLDEGRGTTTADISGNGGIGTLLNSPSWQTGSSCKFGDCLSFTGSSSQSVSVPSSNAISIQSSTSSFTLSFWFKISSTPTSTEALVSKSGLCTGSPPMGCGDTGYGVELTSSGHLEGILMNDGSALGSATGSGSISTGVWHNVVFVDNAGALTLYLDDSSYGTGTATAGSIVSTNPLTFGSDGSNGMYFTGSIDEVKLYGSALSPSLVTGLYSGSSSFSNAFYANETISSNIHDVQIGQAQLQNGAGSPAQQTYYKYNTFGELLTQKQSHNGGWIYTTYTYDHYGNRITMTDAMGTTHYHYSSTYSSAYLTLTSVMVGSSNITQSYTYSSSTGYMLSETDGNGHTTSYSYDNIGRTTEVTYPAIEGVSATITYVYYDSSNYVTITNQNGNVVKQYYDGLGRLTSVQTYNGTNLYSTESYTYNWDNEVATNTLPGSSVYTYTYNQDGQQIKVVNPDSTSSTTAYNTVANTKTVTDANGHPTVYTYDWDGRLLSVKQYYSATGYYTTSYTYDLSGNLLSTTDANGATTTYHYDDLNRLIKTTYPGGSYLSQSYNSVGDLSGEVNPGGTLMNYTYDALNRLTQVSYPGGSTLSYTYDSDGNVLSIVNSAVSTYYTYDALDRVTNDTQVISSHKYTILYGYDKIGNTKSILYPDSTNVTMTYDFLNRVTQVGTPSAPSSFAKITYTVDSVISKITYGDGETTTYSYNSMDRPSQIDMKSSGGVKTLDLNYTYDSDGNVKTMNTESYGYNWLNELTSASGPWGSITYGYDPVGNMLNQTLGSTTKYTYGTYNELTSIGKVNFTYDGNGNTHTIDNKTILWTYNYDYNNRLDQVENNGVTVATYSYDGNGMLVQSVEKSTQVFAYQGGNRIYAKNTGSGSVADYIYAGGMILASVNGTTRSYYHEDALGSVRVITSTTGSTLFTTDYKPYGPTYGASGLVAFEYAGKPTDPVTGLYYSGARFYDPASGRFMTEDSVTGNQYAPLTLNRYLYADDNPMTLVDPSGHLAIDGEVYKEITTEKKTTVKVVGGSVVVSSSVTVVPVSPPPSPPPSTPSVTPSNIAPQTSTNTAASPPSNSEFQEVIEQSTANDVASQPAASSVSTAPSVSTTVSTQTSTSTSIESTSSNPPGTIQLPAGQTVQGYNEAISTSSLLVFNGLAGIAAGEALCATVVGCLIGFPLATTQLGGIVGEGIYVYNTGYGITQQGAIQAYGEGETEGVYDAFSWVADHAEGIFGDL
jgi:RHS repeat-associated protein